jgi:hypothetical protein
MKLRQRLLRAGLILAIAVPIASSTLPESPVAAATQGQVVHGDRPV